MNASAQRQSCYSPEHSEADKNQNPRVKYKNLDLSLLMMTRPLCLFTFTSSEPNIIHHKIFFVKG